MKKEVAEAWVKDLRSNPKQAKKTLFDGEGHCCLGRLCVVLGVEFRKKEGEGRRFPLWYPYLPDKGKFCAFHNVLSPEIEELSGMHSVSGAFKGKNGTWYTLTDMNDGGASFDEISDVIEQNWELI